MEEGRRSLLFTDVIGRWGFGSLKVSSSLESKVIPHIGGMIKMVQRSLLNNHGRRHIEIAAFLIKPKPRMRSLKIQLRSTQEVWVFDIPAYNES